MKIGDTHNNPPAQLQHAKRVHDPKQVAREFEALFTNIMLRSMRSTVNRGDFIPESIGEKIYTEMLDDEYAKLMSQHGSLGLAELILEEMEKNENSTSALNSLRGLNRSPWMIDPRMVPHGTSASETASLSNRISAYEHIITEASEKYDIDSSLITAVIAQESAGNPNAVSHAGAKGLMQLIDSTAQLMGVRRVFDPRENIHGGTRYLKAMLEQYGGDERLALAAYNAGPAAVDKYNGIPPYRETQHYVDRVLSYRDRFKQSQQTNKDGEQ